MKIGEYIRSENGIIGKFLAEHEEKEFVATEDYMLHKSEIKKSAKRITDLIENEDIAIIEYYSRKCGKRIKRRFEVYRYEDDGKGRLYFENTNCFFRYDLKENKWIKAKGLNPKIISVVSHEQFEVSQYNLEEI